MSGSGPRLRFAPSPTGRLHLGNARTALVNWLVSRSSGGTLILRIEDTDTSRNDPQAEEGIIEGLRWLGVDWDEGPDRGGAHGPYRQSERAARYVEAAEKLMQRGSVYPCFCTSCELAEAREAAREERRSYRYPGTCAQLSRKEIDDRSAAGQMAALRFRVPDHAVPFVDGLRGRTGVAAGELGDFVILRADGRPTYLLAAVVDDHSMLIDHVIRGEDHLPNTPRQILLYEAFGWSPPAHTHLPMVLAPDRSRLSKRQGGGSIAGWQQRGALGSALANYLALLGWAPPGGKEVLSMQQLLEAFDIRSLSSTNAVFDAEKLAWLNGQHLTALPLASVVAVAEPFLARAGFTIPPDRPRRDWWEQVLDLARPRVRFLVDFVEPLEPLFLRSPWHSLSPALIEGLRESVQVIEAFRAASAENRLNCKQGFSATATAIGTAIGVRGKKLFHPLRLALTAKEGGPDLATLVPLLEQGRELGIEPAVQGVDERLSQVLELIGKCRG